MKVINLGKSNSVLNRFVAELRDRTIQKDSMRFRRNLERVGEIFAYEISKTLDYKTKEVETPLGIAECELCEQPYCSCESGPTNFIAALFLSLT